MPKRTTSNGKPQLECSDGAKMLIDQMKEHPEEFKGYAGKFTSILDKAHTATQGGITAMSTRDAAAIMAAAETHLYEVWLAEDVLTSIMQPKEEPEKNMVYATPVKAGHLAVGKSVLGQIGASLPSAIYAGNGTAQYGEQEYQMELARYKMEMQKVEMERQRKQENEYAMRNTKPFKDFL